MARSVAGFLVLLLLSLVGLAALRGRKVRKELAAKNPPPGRMVDVGGYRLHLNCQGDPAGDGGPTVVLESGNAECSLGWFLVQREVARFAPVCAYDRAGLAWSERGPKPRTTANIVEELHTLLDRAGVKPPYVLVGHSIGGIFVRYYANRYPEEVAGMVLVDPGHEEQGQRFPSKIQQFQVRSMKLLAMVLRLLQMMIVSGLTTLIPGRGGMPSQMLAMVPKEVQRDLENLLESRPVHLKTMSEETMAAVDNMDVLNDEQMSSLGDMPLVLLSAGSPMGESDVDALKRFGITAEDLEQLQVVSGELHEELTASSSNGRRVVVEDCGHHIQVERPELVVEAIRQVVEAVRWQGAGGRLTGGSL